MTNDLMKIAEEVKLELQRSTITTQKDYCFENAFVAATLAINEVTDKSKRPARDVCTPESIHKAILTMAVLGLNPAKSQCYFIVYGDKLQCVMSYMGAIMTAKLVNQDIDDIRAQIVYEGDAIELEIVNGRDIVTNHKRKFGSINKSEIIGAYAIAVDSEDKILFSTIMTMDEIKTAWKQSKIHPVTEKGFVKSDSVHGKFTSEMAKKSVYNRLCKMIINTSNDGSLLNVIDQTEITEEETIIQEIKQNANQKVIDFAPKKSDDEYIPAEAMATKDHCKRIYALETQANRQDRTLETVGSFVGRKIAGLTELTAKEAESYLDIASQELNASQQEEDQPDWG